MKKTISILVGIAILFGLLCAPVVAKTATENNFSLQELIQSLQQQIEALKAQIEALSVQIESLRQARMEVKETAKEIKVTLKLIRRLQIGMTGEDIKLLQETLATDPDIYPEGLVTGYFGPLTKNAVKRFQKIAGIEQVGLVGPQTLSRINELLAEGAGESGKVPPGLLIAPGIRKKLGFEPKPLPGQVLPPGIAKKIGEEPPTPEDTTAPVISEMTATDITATSAKITWLTDEEADSKVWYDTVTPLVITDSTPMESSSDLVLDHEIALSDLTPSTTYYYLVSSADAAGNYEISIEGTFDTLSEDTTAPIISELSATDTTTTSTMITWLTDEEADSKVWYDTVTPLVITDSTPMESSSDLVLDHEIALSDLTPSTTYYYLVSSADAVGNTTTSAEETFDTLSE